MRAAQCIEDQGLEIRGLSIRQRDKVGPLSEVAYIDEIFLSCPTDLQALISGKIPINHIVVRRPVIRATRNDDGAWNAAGLLPLPKFGDRSPDSIVIEAGSAELRDERNPGATPLLFRDGNFTLSPVEDATHGSKTIAIRGSVSGNMVEHLRINDATFDAATSHYAVKGNIEGFVLSPELREMLPLELGKKMQMLGTLRAQAKGSFSVSSTREKGQLPSFEVDGSIVAGRIHDERLPYPLNDLQANIFANNDGVILRDLVAHSGRSTLRLHCRTWGYSATSPIYLEAAADRVVLDRAWLDVLPRDSILRVCWEKFSPGGEFNATARLAFDGQRWTPDLTLHCTDASFAYHKFPYKVEHASGTLTLKNNQLEIKRITGLAGGQTVELSAFVLNPGAGFTGWVQVGGNNFSVDHKLLEAIESSPGKHGEIVRSLNASGTFGFNLLISRQLPDQMPVNLDLTLQLRKCSLKYAKFAYPVRNIKGIVRMSNNHWMLENLQGDNGSGTIQCNGRYTPLQVGGELVLSFAAQNIPLEDELKNALPVTSHRVWDDLKPRGTIDLEADVTYQSGARAPVVVVRASPAAGRTISDVSIEPSYFPVRLDEIQASLDEGRSKNWAFVYRDGYVQFPKLTARHANIKVAAGGHCEFGPDGRWHLSLQGLRADGIRRENNAALVSALPPALQRTIAELKPSGSIFLHNGSIDLRREAGVDDPVTSQWKLDLQMQQGTLNCGVKLANIFGGIHLEGLHDGQKLECRGELEIDSVTFRDFQFTRVTGPVYIDESRVLLGAWPETTTADGKSRRMQARSYGGIIQADCAASLGPNGFYNLRADLTGGNLSRFAGEAIPGQQTLRGDVFGSIHLTGAGGGLHTLQGEGKLQLRNAYIYDLPLIFALMKIWSARAPDTNAFTSGDLAFRVDGEHIILDNIDFAGDAFCLSGQGQMDLETRLDLELHALGPRSQLQLPVVKDLVGEASQRIMKIHVSGTLAEPKATNEAFPEINQALQAIQQGNPLFQQAREPTRRSLR